MAQSYKQFVDQALDFWLARAAVLVIVILQIAIVNDLMMGPRWLAPALELALLIPLSIATAWTQRVARKASTDEQWNLVGRRRVIVRRLAISLTAIDVTLVNFGALARLVEAYCRVMPARAEHCFWMHSTSGSPTSSSSRCGTGRWIVAAGLERIRPDIRNDFLFTQQQPAGESCLHPGWSPGFIDYLFLAFTNATAFSPADTFPLTVRAKLLMMAESAISFATIALVASRAVGILN
jgi:hypothetical protein